MLDLTGISKKFGPHAALTDVDLTIAAGEIHGLVGLNGSGKSTLLNILIGSSLIRETGGFDGSYFFDGAPAEFTSPAQAMAAGIGMVHQELALIPQMTVAANIMLNREKGYPLTDLVLPRGFSLLDRKENNHEARRALKRLTLPVDPAGKTGKFPVNIKQYIEIAREISRNDLKLLLLDEPTAVLNGTDARLFLDTLRTLAGDGLAILFVSHRLHEVFSICDRFTVLREGRRIDQGEVRGTSAAAVTRAMTRHEVTKVTKTRSRSSGDTLMAIRNFHVAMPGEGLQGLDLEIYRGEILGLTSLSGHGKLAFGAGLMGHVPNTGDLHYADTKLPRLSAAEMIARGIFFLSEDRSRLGLFSRHSVMDNIAFTALHHRNRFLHPRLPSWMRFPDGKAIRKHAEHCIELFTIRCTGPDQSVAELSGGNQQKVRIAHALTLSPQLLIVNEPTRGIDIAAKERILELFLSINRDAGTTIVIASSELEELRRVCDRIAVLYQGRLHAILDPLADELLFSQAISGETLRN